MIPQPAYNAVVRSYSEKNCISLARLICYFENLTWFQVGHQHPVVGNMYAHLLHWADAISKINGGDYRGLFCVSLIGYLRRLFTTQGIKASAAACGVFVDLWTGRGNSVKQKVLLMSRLCEVLTAFLPCLEYQGRFSPHLSFTGVPCDLFTFCVAQARG